MSTIIQDSRVLAEDVLIEAYGLLLQHGARARLSEREMLAFEVGVHLGQVATINVLDGDPDVGHAPPESP